MDETAGHDIDDAALAHLERLTRLVIEPSERESLRHDLVELLGFVDSLLQVDVSGVEEYGREVAPDAPRVAAVIERADVVEASLARDAALDLAPEAADGFIVVPRTVDEG
mgnify:FL=1